MHKKLDKQKISTFTKFVFEETAKWNFLEPLNLNKRRCIKKLYIRKLCIEQLWCQKTNRYRPNFKSFKYFKSLDVNFLTVDFNFVLRKTVIYFLQYLLIGITYVYPSKINEKYLFLNVHYNLVLPVNLSPQQKEE